MRIEGKTKICTRDPADPREGETLNKHVVTWDDQFSEPMEGKGNWSNQTNAGICELLKHAGEPVAFIRTTGPNTYRHLWCRMIRLEVIVRVEIDKKKLLSEA